MRLALLLAGIAAFVCAALPLAHAEAPKAEGAKLAAPKLAASLSTLFAFGAGTYVTAGEAPRAGLVMTPPGLARGTKLPVVVFLHGLNERGPLHMWLGSPGRADLRPVFARAMRDRPFALVAPSQTIHADNPWKLWDALDASALVSSAGAALEGATVLDATQVFVVAHSGGACNLHGGALGATLGKGPVQVRGLVVLDSCFDVPTAARYLEIPTSVPVWVRYQTDSWERDIPGFLRSVRAQPNIHVAHAGARGPGAHDAVLTSQLPSMLGLLPFATAP